MKRLLIWYIPQAALFFGGAYIASQTEPPITMQASLFVGLMLAAAYTGAANLLISLAGRWERSRSARQQRLRDDLLRR